MTAWMHYFHHSLRDGLRHHPVTRSLGASWLSFRAGRTDEPTRRLALLARAAHVCPNGSKLDRLNGRIREALADLSTEEIDWNQLGAKASPDIPKAVLLKPPVSAREKGVLHIAFEQQWLRLLLSGQANAVAERYDIVLSPSWSPPPEPALLLMAKLWPGRVFTMLSNVEDAERMRAVSDNCVPVPLLASHWVDAGAFEPYLTPERDIDIVMLANFAEFKRHWLFFHALRDLPREYNVTLLGVPLAGRTEADLRREADAYGVGDRFDLVVRPSRDDIAKVLCRAKTSLIFSQREGSCIAVAESLFADVPVGLFADAHIGSKVFINESTGRLLTRRGLAAQLREFVELADGYAPRAWALENIDSQRSTEVLTDAMKEYALRDGQEWTTDLVPFQQHTLFRYLSEETTRAMAPWVDEFEARYGIRLGAKTREATAGTETAQPVG